MGRPERVKRVCKKPGYNCFVPQGVKGKRKQITLTIDEYETIRLIDLEGVSREECAERMDIARTTAQAIYNSARVKIAECIVNGMQLRIEGGTFYICDGTAGCPHCCRSQSHSNEITIYKNAKETQSMRIAVTYENGEVFQHFGHTEYFKIYDVEGTEIKCAEVYGSNGAGHGALAGVLFNSGVNVLICGGLGAGAMNALTNAGIEVIAGATGDVDEAVQAYLAGNLVSTGSNCNHHEHEGGHSCGSHGCGSHGCRE